MAEDKEKPEAPAQAAKEAQKPQQKEPAKETPKQEAPAAKAQAKKRKSKKINKMSLKEIEEKLSYIKEKMGNLQSSYAKQLLKQKEGLTKAKV